MNPMPIILDTDMAGDCDDAGALAVLHALCDSGEATLLGVTQDVSSRYGVGCVDAINAYYGRVVPVGNLKEAGLYDDERHNCYNRAVAQRFPNRYPVADDAPNAVMLLRTLLAARPSADVHLCGIGPLRVLSRLLASEPDACSPLDGEALVRHSVARLVVMGGCFSPVSVSWRNDGAPDILPEFNIVGDIPSAQHVVERWPTPIIFCGYEIGYGMITGRPLLAEMNPHNPVTMAYQLYGTDGRDSWDPATVLYTVRGARDYWRESPPGRVSIDDQGFSLWRCAEHGNHRYLVPCAPKERIAEVLDALLLKDVSS